MVLEFFELVNHFRGEQFSPRAHYLPEFDKGGSELFQGKSYPFVDSGSIGTFLPVSGEPEPGPSWKYSFKPDAEAIFSQHVHDLCIPHDPGNHAYNLAVAVLKACFYS